MDGIIVINKEKEYTSHDVVAKIRRILNLKKVGHTGTLDPNATGVLPILLGQGTKLSKYLINHDKTYEVLLKLGIKTDTADIEGNIIETKEIDYSKINKDNLNKILKELIGKQKQVPPMYSAIKVKGKKLYEYARKGIKIDVEPRNIEIYNTELLDFSKDEIIFKVDCSKGTYIRSICEKLAEELNTVGHMKDLKRTKVDIFEIKDAITISKIDESINNTDTDKNKLDTYIISIEEFFKDKEKISLNNKEIELFLNGVKLDFNKYSDDIYRIYNKENIFIGIGEIKEGIIKRDIIV